MNHQYNIITTPATNSVTQALILCGFSKVQGTDSYTCSNVTFDDNQWRAIAKSDTNVASQVFKFQVK